MARALAGLCLLLVLAVCVGLSYSAHAQLALVQAELAAPPADQEGPPEERQQKAEQLYDDYARRFHLKQQAQLLPLLRGQTLSQLVLNGNGLKLAASGAAALAPRLGARRDGDRLTVSWK